MQEKNFMLRGDQQDVADNEATIKEVYALCDELGAKFYYPKNKALVASVKTSAEKYQKAFDSWVYGQQQTEAEAMVTHARDFLDQAETLRADQKSELSRLRDRNAADAEIDDKLWKADAESTDQVRRGYARAGNFMLRGDQQDVADNEATIKEVDALCDELGAKSNDPKNKPWWHRLTSAEKYQKAFILGFTGNTMKA
ncbi:MAG: hypothetical protein U5K27_10365 [Desulfotignum sp.]|nr:hypothetical protein [Desulfotignum sp.]